VESKLLKSDDDATVTIVSAICYDAATDDGIVWSIPSADRVA
jgi:hypothetical protein